MIIDGRALTEEVLIRTKTRATALGRAPRVLAIVANETPATKSYLAIKTKRATNAGCVLGVQQFPRIVSIEELQSAITASGADAIIVQLPLPTGIDAQAVCNVIPIEKDADVLSDSARQKFARGDSDACVPPVVGAIAEIFRVHDVDPRGKKAVVIGRGFLVGAPAALWLAQQGAQVTVVNRSTKDFVEALHSADIIVSGAGYSHLIKPEMLKQGVILIDAGTSESDGEVVGDADPACVGKCSLFTPVPGGVGPLAVACLFENAVALAERATNK
jgi:methylenetetrahydrofolate dehydrogenase (NADP+)/methenyltetrahydrofolate cyclohydrolase